MDKHNRIMESLSYKESYFRTVSILTQHMEINKITVSEIAQVLEVPRKKLGEVLNKKRIDIELLDDLYRLLFCTNIEIRINK